MPRIPRRFFSNTPFPTHQPVGEGIIGGNGGGGGTSSFHSSAINGLHSPFPPPNCLEYERHIDTRTRDDVTQEYLYEDVRNGSVRMEIVRSNMPQASSPIGTSLSEAHMLQRLYRTTEENPFSVYYSDLTRGASPRRSRPTPLGTPFVAHECLQPEIKESRKAHYDRILKALREQFPELAQRIAKEDICENIICQINFFKNSVEYNDYQYSLMMMDRATKKTKKVSLEATVISQVLPEFEADDFTWGLDGETA